MTHPMTRSCPIRIWVFEENILNAILVNIKMKKDNRLVKIVQLVHLHQIMVKVHVLLVKLANIKI